MTRLTELDRAILAAARDGAGTAMEIAGRVKGATPRAVWGLREMGYLRHTADGLVLTDDGRAILDACPRCGGERFVRDCPEAPGKRLPCPACWPESHGPALERHLRIRDIIEQQSERDDSRPWSRGGRR